MEIHVYLNCQGTSVMGMRQQNFCESLWFAERMHN